MWRMKVKFVQMFNKYVASEGQNNNNTKTIIIIISVTLCSKVQFINISNYKQVNKYFLLEINKFIHYLYNLNAKQVKVKQLIKNKQK